MPATGFFEKRKGAAVVICKVDDRGKAVSVLQKAGIATISADALKSL